jgi:CelD/BcsL family acetyltransferase involved in cellulose biosynthesis
MELDVAEGGMSADTVQRSGGVAAPRPRALRTADFKLSIVQDLEAVRDEWQAFERQAASTPFQTYRWMRAWQAAIEGAKTVSPLIVLGHRDGRLAFILPFAVERRRGVRRLVWFGHELADYNGPLIEPQTLKRLPESFVSDMLDYARTQVPGIDHMCLAKQPETLGGRANPFARFRGVPFTCDAHSARLSDNWDDFSQAHRSARSLRRLREKEKRLARQGDVAFEAVIAAAERERLMDRLIAWKVAQLTARGDRVPFADPAARRLLCALARTTADDPRFRLYALKSKGSALALAFCLVGHGRLVYYLCAYEEGPSARFSPGLLLLVHIFKAAIDEGLEVFDFSNGDEDYKAQWIDRSDAIFVSLMPFTFKGRIAAAADRAELEAIRWVKRHPPLLGFANRFFRSWRSARKAIAGSREAAIESS